MLLEYFNLKKVVYLANSYLAITYLASYVFLPSCTGTDFVDGQEQRPTPSQHEQHAASPV